MELKGLGVSVLVLVTGGVATDITAKSMDAARADAAQTSIYRKIFDRITEAAKQVRAGHSDASMPAAEYAAIVSEVATRRRPPAFYYAA